MDSNVYLSFYHYSKSDIEALEKVAHLIEGDEINLLLPEQVIDEVRRNRPNKIKDALTPLKGYNFSPNFPAYCKDYQEYKKLRSLLQDCEKARKDLVIKLEGDISSKSLLADKLIDKIFLAATPIARTDTIIDLARRRVDIGNPPGKRGSIGDAIIWESLLSSAPPLGVMHFVSDDKDWYDPNGETDILPFLRAEMTQFVDGHRTISDFLSLHYPNIVLSDEYKKEALVENLLNSSNFSQTHGIIAELQKFSFFTSKQAKILIKALAKNTQVNWIVGDADVYGFFAGLLDSNELDFIFSEFGQAAKELIDTALD